MFFIVGIACVMLEEFKQVEYFRFSLSSLTLDGDWELDFFDDAEMLLRQTAWYGGTSGTQIYHCAG